MNTKGAVGMLLYFGFMLFMFGPIGLVYGLCLLGLIAWSFE